MPETKGSSSTEEGCLSGSHVGWSKTSRCLLMLVVVGTYFLSISSIVVLGTAKHLSQEIPDKPFTFCLPCKDLQQTRNPRDVAGVTIPYRLEIKGNTEICCAHNETQALEMLHLQNERHISTQDRNEEKSFDFIMVSAQKRLIEPQYHSEWDYHQMPTFMEVTLNINTSEIVSPFEHVREVDLAPTGPRIKYGGHYFVYKSLHLVPDSYHVCRKFHRQDFSSILQKKTGEVTHDLLTSIHTCCPDCVQNRETMFTGGIYDLQEGDIIQVQVNAERLVYFAPDVTYVGLTMLPQD